MNVSLYSVSVTLVLACSEGLLWGESQGLVCAVPTLNLKLEGDCRG